jgi:hypothetical protein
MKISDEILSEITNIAERWIIGRENDDEAMDKIAAILKENNRISRNYYDIINTSTKNEY